MSAEWTGNVDRDAAEITLAVLEADLERMERENNADVAIELHAAIDY